MSQHGWADEGFGAVADAFAGNFAEGRELGSAVAVFADGRKVVDLWGGTADERTGRVWDEHTVLPVMSVTKGLISICAHLLAEQGKLDLDAPVADHWPEFAQGGKAGITPRMVLANTAGIPLTERKLPFEELTRWTPVIRALEEQEVLYEPGIAYEYHAHAFGFIVGELIRRLTGRTPGGYFRAAVGDGLGLRTWIGMPQEEVPRRGRLAEAAGRSPLPDAGLLPMRALTMNGVLPFPGLDDPHGYNSPALLTAEFPAAGGVSSARGLAALYAAVATGVDGGPRLLGADTVTDAVRQLSGGPSWSGLPDLGARWGSGFLVDSPFRRMLGARSFGNSGAGGQFAFGDDEFGVGFAYTANLMGAGNDPRVDRLIGALRTCVGAPEPAAGS
ncbi:serine hydrolase domain-containing protein [Streptomyces sp. NPDC058773]|uniref:serine hydrolase domain-containing protein n=1 Tax=Streptomyces sp. NPDC058773 TaxID=3346632 RepID=UPI00369328FA